MTRWRAPQVDGGVLAVPPLDAVEALLAEPPRLSLSLLGRPIDEIRSLARRECLEQARNDFQIAGEPVPEIRSPRLLLAGHQPELFHPGVWIKNFALHRLAQQYGLTPLNLIIDNDTVKTTAIPVPIWSEQPDQVRSSMVAFDRWQGEIPYETLAVADHHQFETFPKAVAELTSCWPFRPLLDDFWDAARTARLRTPRIGDIFAAARRALERRWACHQLEISMSRLSGTEAFAVFAGHWLLDLPRFHCLYNECIREHRRLNRIRSRHHPVPELTAERDWLEAPFWGWRVGERRRGRLFVRLNCGALQLRVDDQIWPSLPVEPQPFLTAFRQLAAQGYAVRPRALTTTMFARLCLADAFIHGIGGGKYDELTDAIIRAAFGCEPPGYLVLSATLRLPLPGFAQGPDDVRHWRRRERDLFWKPESFVGELNESARGWVEEKQRCIAAFGVGRHRREQFHILRKLTEQLRPLTEPLRHAALRQRRQAEMAVEANAVLQRRDFSFVLFPEEMLQGFYQSVMGNS